MTFVELFLDFLSKFNARKWLHLVVVILTIGVAGWFIDRHFRYSRFYIADKQLAIAERINALEKGEGISPHAFPLIELLLRDPALGGDQLPDGSLAHNSDDKWYSPKWVRAIFGGLPWFLMSLGVLSGPNKNKRATMVIFWGLQSFTLTFGLIHLLLPRYGGFLLDYLAIPMGLYLACAIMPSSLVALTGMKKVQENGKAVAIRNNLLTLRAAAHQFYLEHGQTEAAFSDLVGEGKYVTRVDPVDGERYDLMKFKQGEIYYVKRTSGEIVAVDS